MLRNDVFSQKERVDLELRRGGKFRLRISRSILDLIDFKNLQFLPKKLKLESVFILFFLNLR